MAVTLLSNISALRASRQLALTSTELGQTYERLSSGQRINRASDDASGLAISSILRAEARIAGVAIRNANDGISATAIGNAAFDAITNILVRMSELAEQSANGTYSTNQRSPIQAEFAALGSEIERIALTARFNGIALLSSSGSLALQVGLNSGASSQINLPLLNGTLSGIRLALGGNSALSYSVIDNSIDNSQLAARTALEAVREALDDVTSKRGLIGGAERRLEFAINNLESARDNFIQAESRIRDADVATETANLVRLNILQQSGIAILAQANLQPQVALKLLSFD
jgi:flagellin